MSNIFLVDTENVNIFSLNHSHNLTSSDMIILFVTEFTCINNFCDSNIDKISTDANIMKIHVDTGTKNSLDFQLVTYLGLLIGEHNFKNEINKYFIVSRDKGFLSSINLINTCSKHKVYLINSISSLFIDDEDDITSLFIDKFTDLGFTRKTSIKMCNLLFNSSSEIVAIDNFNKSFGYNSSVLNKCLSIIVDYFKTCEIKNPA